MSESDMGGQGSVNDAATVSTMGGGSVDNHSIEGGDGGVMVKRGGTAAAGKPTLLIHPINPSDQTTLLTNLSTHFQHKLSIHPINPPYQHTLSPTLLTHPTNTPFHPLPLLTTNFTSL